MIKRKTRELRLNKIPTQKEKKPSFLKKLGFSVGRLFSRFSANSQQAGFTLLEVLVAMAIVGLVLGTAFGLLAGSRRLAFKAMDDIERTVFLRSAINAAQIVEEPDYPELPERYKKSLDLDIGEILEKPERQTRPIRLALEPYTLRDNKKGIELSSFRLIKLDTAQ
jgi:general secretion pathway protein I